MKIRFFVLGSAIAAISAIWWGLNGSSPSEQSQEAACEAGDYNICFELAERLDSRPPRDEARIMALYRRSCEGDVAEGCSLLAEGYASGRGGDADDDLALAADIRACELGDTSGCVGAGLRVAEQDMSRAAAFFSTACSDEVWVGCARLGVLYRNGQGVDPDHVEAASLFRRSCENGLAFSCFFLGEMYQAGDGVVQDYVRAYALYELSVTSGAYSARLSLEQQMTAEEIADGEALAQRCFESGIVVCLE